MAVTYSAAVKNARMDAVLAQIDGGAATGGGDPAARGVVVLDVRVQQEQRRLADLDLPDLGGHSEAVELDGDLEGLALRIQAQAGLLADSDLVADALRGA